MKRYFWNVQENRPRAIWRLLIQMLVWNGLILLIMIPLAWANDWSLSFSAFLIESPDWVRALTLLVTVLLMGRFVDIRHFSEYGLDIRDKEWWKDFIVGLLLGALTITVVFLVQVALGWLEIRDTFYVPGHGLIFMTVGGSFLAAVSAAVYETLWIWSYTLRNASEGFIYLNRLNGRVPIIGALVLCLIYYVLFRVFSTGDVTTVFISNVFRAGLILALPFILTQRLGLSIGLFLGWTMFQANVFGLHVVGGAIENPSFLVINEIGPDLWTGGSAGFGNGLLAMMGLLVLSVIITVWDKRRTGKTMFDGSMAYYDPTSEVDVRSSN